MAPPDLTTVTGSPAGYGKSCTNCSKAKCKCILRTDGAACERCHRLGKTCQPMAASRRRMRKKTTTTSRTTQLEEKLDDLVSILRATQGSNQHQVPVMASTSASTTASASASASAPPPNPPYPETSSFPSCSRLDSLATAATSSPSQTHLLNHQPSHQPDHQMNHQPTRQPHPQSRHPFGLLPVMPESEPGPDETWRLPEPTPAEAETYLEKFRGWLSHFPCILIPPDMTAAKLKEERPFLWLCIMNITSMSVPQHLIMKERVQSELASRILLGHERGMDVLQGLVVYIGWATLNAGPTNKPFLITYCQLATILVYDMSLTRAPMEEQHFTVCFKLWGGRPAPPKMRTMEERRVLLSLWFLTSAISGFIGKMDSLRWTPHMEDCLNVLEREQDHPWDAQLVTLVKIQLVAEEAQKLLVRDVMGDSSQAPTHVFKKGMLSQLHDVRGGLPPTTLNNFVLQTHLLAAEVQVHSVGLFMQTIPQIQRIECMFQCLESIRSWYDIFFAVPPLEFPGIPFTLYMQLSSIQVALYRLTTSEDPAWDKDLVRNTANLISILNRVNDKFLAVSQAYEMRCDDPEGTIFAKGAKILQKLRNSWEPVLSRHLGGIPTPNSQATGLSYPTDEIPPSSEYTVPEHLNIDEPPMSIDFGDTVWWTDVFGPWEF